MFSSTDRSVEIPGRVTMAIVHRLEVIQVHHAQATWLPVARDAFLFIRELFIHGTAVPGARQMIDQADIRHDANLQRTQFGLEEDCGIHESIVVGGSHRRSRQTDPAQRTGEPVHLLPGGFEAAPQVGPLRQVVVAPAMEPAAESRQTVRLGLNIGSVRGRAANQRPMEVLQPSGMRIGHAVQIA